MEPLSVLIASDSFKGSASSQEINTFLEQGVRRVVPDAYIRCFSIADGGEGSVDAIVSACGGKYREVEVRGPLGDPVIARYGLVDSKMAIIEMAAASGITLITQNSAHARRASTFGVGQMILDALDAGAKKILIGLGGSATSDGGVGMAKALGIRFLDAEGKSISCGLEGLERLASIDCSHLSPKVRNAEFVALTDVSNPLCGPTGAIYVYGPQKGIQADEVKKLDGWMQNYAGLLEEVFGRDIASIKGSGAAGGLGAALVAFCDASIKTGIEYVLDTIRLDDFLVGVDFVITGEGRMDAQSAFGKAPVGVAKRAKRRGIPVVAVVGSRAADLGSIYEAGVDLVIPATYMPATLKDCIEGVAVSIPIAGESATRAFLLGRGQIED